MKLKFVVQDVTYMRALAAVIEKSDQNIYIEIGKDFDQNDGVMIVSDIEKGEYFSYGKDRSGTGIVFLDDISSPVSGKIREGGPFRIYKYCRVSEMLAELRLFYCIWSGESIVRRSDPKTVSVMTDRDPLASGVFSEMFSRQYAYRVGGEVLLINFGYIDTAVTEYDSSDTFSRMAYMIDRGMDFPAEAFFYKDNYGVSHFRRTYGINPIALLDDDTFEKICDHLSSRVFDLMILNIGTEFSKRNVAAANRAGNKYWIQTLEPERPENKYLMDQVYNDTDSVRAIYAGHDPDRLPLAADDMVRELFRVNINDERDSDQVF